MVDPSTRARNGQRLPSPALIHHGRPPTATRCAERRCRHRIKWADIHAHMEQNLTDRLPIAGGHFAVAADCQQRTETTVGQCMERLTQTNHPAQDSLEAAKLARQGRSLSLLRTVSDCELAHALDAERVRPPV